MSTKITEVYTAFKDLGVAEEKAVKAAEAISNIQTATKSDINAVRDDVFKLDKDMLLLKWMVGFNLAFTMAILYKL